jgi:hypothetical protein
MPRPETSCCRPPPVCQLCPEPALLPWFKFYPPPFRHLQNSLYAYSIAIFPPLPLLPRTFLQYVSCAYISMPNCGLNIPKCSCCLSNLIHSKCNLSFQFPTEPSLPYYILFSGRLCTNSFPLLCSVFLHIYVSQKLK